jgi:hypothetical protein
MPSTPSPPVHQVGRKRERPGLLIRSNNKT